MKYVAIWMCVMSVGLLHLQQVRAQATVTPEPTNTPAPWPTMTVLPGQSFPGMLPLPTPVDAGTVPNGFEALSRENLWALLIHLTEVGVLWHVWVYTRYDAYLTPLEAIMFFLFVFFLFRRKFAKYAGALVPVWSKKQVAEVKANANKTADSATQAGVNMSKETDKV